MRILHALTMQYTIQTVLFLDFANAKSLILALRSLNLPFKYIITSLLFSLPTFAWCPLLLGALRVRVVCLWVNPALKLRTLQICNCVQLNALFCGLWRNVDASCHKRFVVSSGNQHRRLLPAMCHNLRDGSRPPATAFTTPAAALTQAVKLNPLAFDAPLGGLPSEYCYAVWHEKTRMAWLPDGENFLMKCLFVLT